MSKWETSHEVDPLTRLAIKHGTDKWGPHFYTPVYHERCVTGQYVCWKSASAGTALKH
jgi:hypothetical protein